MPLLDLLPLAAHLLYGLEEYVVLAKRRRSANFLPTVERHIVTAEEKEGKKRVS